MQRRSASSTRWHTRARGKKPRGSRPSLTADRASASVRARTRAGTRERAKLMRVRTRHCTSTRAYHKSEYSRADAEAHTRLQSACITRATSAHKKGAHERTSGT
eukprot:6192268-Pleurochrysis_carterae.AAC.4